MLEILNILGYMPFPGSLNLELDKPFDYTRAHITADVTEKPRPGAWNNNRWTPRPFHFWPITINGVEGHAVKIEGKVRRPTFLEVYAPSRLRDLGNEFDIRHR